MPPLHAGLLTTTSITNHSGRSAGSHCRKLGDNNNACSRSHDRKLRAIARSSYRRGQAHVAQ
jgi:hypothetical protein